MSNTKISASHTYIFDCEDLEQLDDLSLTGLMEQAVQAPESQDDEPMDNAQSIDSSDTEPVELTMNEPTIDELLQSFDAESGQRAGEGPEQDDFADTGTFQAIEVLLAPEAMFSTEDFDEES